MKISEKQFNNAKEGFVKNSLSSDEKNKMLSNIYSNNTIEVIDDVPVHSSISIYSLFIKQKVFVLAALLLFIFSGTAYAATNSLPGDVLYGVKVNVIEPVSLVLKFTEKSKSEYKLKLLEKRIQEVEILKSKYSFDLESKEESLSTTSKNIQDLNNSPIFNKSGVNKNLDIKVKNYNDLTNSNIGKDIDINVEVKLDMQEDIKSVKDKIIDDMNIAENKIEKEIEKLTEKNVEIEIKDKVEL